MTMRHDFVCTSPHCVAPYILTCHVLTLNAMSLVMKWDHVIIKHDFIPFLDDWTIYFV